MTLTEIPRRLRGAVPTVARSTRRPDRAASLPPATRGLGRGLVAMRHGLIAGALAQAFGAPVAFSIGAAAAAFVLALVALKLRAPRAETAADAASERTTQELDRRAA